MSSLPLFLFTSGLLAVVRSSVVVDTSLGPVEGTPANPLLGTCAAFYGIPYAAPPTGKERFRPPQPATPWQSPRSAKKVGKSCMQGFGDGFIQLPPWLEDFVEKRHVGVDPMDEDCLYLNVFSPNLKASDLPVMVWIHGGGFLGGSGDRQSGVPFYDGHNMCHEGGNIIVSMNYRLGIFGFYASDELLKETGTVGNMGIQDQRAALEWVQANAKNFGGSPQRVTIFGESAGAFSVASHLVYPKSAPLFSAAIMESGGLSFFPLVAQKNKSQVVATQAGCPNNKDTLACMRSINSTALLHAQMAAKYGKTDDDAIHIGTTPLKTSPYDHSYIPFPTLDGYELPIDTDVRHLVAEGKFSAKPVMIGTNNNESALFTCFSVPANLTEAGFRKNARGDFAGVFGSHSVSEQQLNRLAALYNASSYGSWKRAYIDFNTDLEFYCDSRTLLDGTVKAGKTAFSYRLLATLWFFKIDACLGTPHTTDYLYLFQNMNALLTKDEEDLAKRMTTYWSNFAKHQAPGDNWPAYGAARNYLRLDIPADAPSSQWKKEQCEFISSITSPPKWVKDSTAAFV